MTDQHPIPPDDHPDDLLSAHLDGELDPATHTWVADHLEWCAPCRRAVEALTEARAMLRALPAVDASPVIEGYVARHHRVVRLGAGFVATAAVILLALGLTAATDRRTFAPDVDALAAGHQASTHEGLGGMRPSTEAYSAPPGLIGSAVSLSRREMWDGNDLAAVVYRDGGVEVSVYEQPGRLDWKRLPPGEVVAIGDGDVWFGPGEPVVAVTQRGDLVVTVVSDDRPAVLTALAGLPEWRRRATWDRVHDACQGLVRAFALQG